jgi:hypothetical protein
MTATLCTVAGCGRPVGRSGARGWCPRCYRRWQRHGDPTAVAPRGGRRPPVDELFWRKVDRTGPVPSGRPELGPCWRWTAATRGGYGAFNTPATDSAPRRRIDAHRWAYERHIGPVPAGHGVEHLCHTADALAAGCGGGPTCPHRACVNPAHLTTAPAGAALRGTAARRAAQTHCPQGHPYDLVDSHGRRRCTQCVRDQAAAAERHTESTTSRPTPARNTTHGETDRA